MLHQIVARLVDEPYFVKYENGTLVLWGYPYVPYSELVIDAYYVASNECYALATRLISELNAIGIGASHAKGIVLQRYALEAGLADFRGDNGLVYHRRYGSRFCIGAVLVAGVACDSVADVDNVRSTPCSKCQAYCRKACPTGAIMTNGQDYAKCLRHLMNTPEKLDANHIKRLQGRVLGCDICQRACPINTQDTVNMPKGLTLVCQDLTDRENIALLANWVGKNMSKPNIIGAIASSTFSMTSKRTQKND